MDKEKEPPKIENSEVKTEDKTEKVETPQETPKEAPKETPKETPNEAPKETPLSDTIKAIKNEYENKAAKDREYFINELKERDKIITQLLTEDTQETKTEKSIIDKINERRARSKF